MKAVLVELGSTMKLRSAMELGLAVRWRIGRDGLMAWDDDVGKMGLRRQTQHKPETNPE